MPNLNFSPVLMDQVLTRLHGPKIKKSHRKQVLILEAFAKCLFEKGLADTSYAAVGSYAGMEPPHIGYYFPNWDSMLDACFHYVIATAQEISVQAMESAESAEARLKALCDAPFIHLTGYPEHAAVLAAFQLECARKKNYRLTHQRIRKAGQERILSILKEMFPRARKQTTSLKKLALAIQAIVVGYGTEWVAGRSTESTASAQAATWETVLALLPSRS
jgi:AcrR family transcriptional regulator